MTLFRGLLVPIDKLDLNFVPDNPCGVGRNLEPRVVSPGAVANIEAPRMPGASDRTIVIELARPQRGPHVRTEVVDGVVLATPVEDGHQLIADGESPPLPFRYGTHFSDGNEFGHGLGNLEESCSWGKCSEYR